jgi:Serine dehydrogenase proteinase
MNAEPPVASVGVAPTAAPIPNPSAPPVDQYYASIWPGTDSPLPDTCKSFAKTVLEFEAIINRPVFVISQSNTANGDMDNITDELADEILRAKNQFEIGKKICVVLHTFGGDPVAAYKIGIFLQKRTGGFEIVIPKKAKSAGTLLALGATKMIMGPMAEIGPLDMQIKDPESDLWDSALNETKSLQTLSREALVLYSSKMELLKKMYPFKTFETKNRIATEFVNEMIRPLVEKIDAVHYTKMARIMEIMKKYGKQLMKRAGYSTERVGKVVESLGEDYPEHAYIIDAREARELGLKVENPKPEVITHIEAMGDGCGVISIVGRISNALKPS